MAIMKDSRSSALFCLFAFACLPALTCSAAEPLPAKVAPFFKQHCVRCHGSEKQEGKLRVDTLAADFASPESARHWVEIMDRLNLGEMPPEGEVKPDVESVRSVAGWIAGELRLAARQSLSRGGRVVLRRLNRMEYSNTIRDLLGITFLPGENPLEWLPPDGVAEGFDKVGAALMIDPSLLDKYFEVAAQIAERAIVDGPPQFPTHKKRFELEDTINNIAIRYLCSQPSVICGEHDMTIMEAGARSFGVFMYPGTRVMIPVKGFYDVRVRASAAVGEKGEPVRMRVRRSGDGQVIMETDVTATRDQPQVYSARVALPAAGGGELSVEIVNGSKFYLYNHAQGHLDRAIAEVGARNDHATVMRLRGRMTSEGLISGSKPNPDTLDHSKLPRLYLDWLELEGPVYEQWPPKSHVALFFKGDGAKNDLSYAREMFEQFLPRAWRRPVTRDEVDPIVRLIQQELDQGVKFEEAIRVGLIAALTSPKFIYLSEPAGDASRPLNDHELAARLSYFLWSSMPDDELVAIATRGELNKPEVLLAQTRRLLNDAKSEALVTGFAAQWLRTSEYRNFTPDPRLYSSYDVKLGEAMVQETLSYFAEILRNDLSALDFIDSDWTMVNDRLAKFYGLDNVRGEQFRRVSLPPELHRGGLLGHAGVMMRGSDGTRTKPVTRGVYVRDVLFNDPPDPPPPNAGEIEPNIQGKNLTVRERLLQHQQIESCASCHRTIDPYGLALENFDAIGAWRTRQNGEGFRGDKAPTIDSSGQLPNGEKFTTPEEFKRLLMNQKERFARGLAEKLLTYALGRPIEASDRGTIDSLSNRMAGDGYSLRSLIEGIVTSDVFRTK